MKNIRFFHLIKLNLFILLTFVGLYYFTLYLTIFNTPYGNIFFFPNALRIIAPIIYGIGSFPGLFLGHIYTGIFINDMNDINLVLYLSLEGSLIGFISYSILKKFKILDKNFKKIKFEKIIFFILFVSILHSLSAFLIYENRLTIELKSFKFIITYIIGDFVGGCIGFYVFLKFYYKVDKFLKAK